MNLFKIKHPTNIGQYLLVNLEHILFIDKKINGLCEIVFINGLKFEIEYSKLENLIKKYELLN